MIFDTKVAIFSGTIDISGDLFQFFMNNQLLIISANFDPLFVIPSYF